MENEKKLKKRMTAPHPYVILLGIILLLAVLTYIIPAGTFDRVQNEAGMTLVVPGTFHYTESHPTNFLSIPQLVMRGIVKNVNMVANVLLVGGAFRWLLTPVRCSPPAKSWPTTRTTPTHAFFWPTHCKHWGNKSMRSGCSKRFPGLPNPGTTARHRA